MMKKIYLIVLLIGISLTGYGQQASFSIPYRVIGGKMVVDFKLNGDLIPMIFDTGGQNSITAELKEQKHLTVQRKQNIKDSNSQVKELEVVTVDKLEVPSTAVTFNSYPFLVVEQGHFNCFGGARGLIGSDLFQDCTIEIDDRKKIIRVLRGGKLMTNDRTCLPLIETGARVPVINIGLGKYKAINVIFDTGAPFFLNLKKDVAQDLLADVLIEKIREGKGGRSMGIHGFVEQSSKISYRAPEILIGKQSFKGFQTADAEVPLSLLGLGVLKYGVATIDYVNRLFKFEPYSNGVIQDDRIFWNVDLTVKDNKLTVATIWDDFKEKIEIGDEVTHIDGTPVGKIDFCESITTGLPLLKGKKQVVLTLKTVDGTKQVTIKKS